MVGRFLGLLWMSLVPACRVVERVSKPSRNITCWSASPSGLKLKVPQAQPKVPQRRIDIPMHFLAAVG